MESLTAVELKKTAGDAVVAVSLEQRPAHPCWRDRIAVLVIASLCVGLAYLYWSA